MPCLLPTAASQVLLNEYVASNINGIADEDGDTSDWIEIYNAGQDAVDLVGYGLSDDEEQPFRWIFPEMVLPPQHHLLIYASGKDRRVWAPHWETIVDWGDTWKYRVNSYRPHPSWRRPDYDDSAWYEGPAGFGYGDNDDSTLVPTCISLCLRRTFLIEDPGTIRFLCLHIDYDDAFVAYLNGAEIARANITSSGSPVWDQPADTRHEALIHQDERPETYVVSDAASRLQAGSNLLAIEVHNLSPTDESMSLIPIFTLGMDEAPPGGGTGVAPFVRFSVPHLHTNFGIAALGEVLSLHNAGGDPLDCIATGQMHADISRGRELDGAAAWHFFMKPTPQEANAGGGAAEFTAPPEFSLAGGFYASALFLELIPPAPSAAIHYTLDGSDPTDSSPLYTAPIQIGETTVVRARATETGYLASRIITHSYVLNEPTTLPTVSLATDPPNLWDNQTGIYAFGDHHDPLYPYFGANFWRNWERPVHIEFFESNGTPVFRLDAGLKIHGGYTRGLPQKSLRLLARGGYGTPSIEYRIFAEKEIDAFRCLILRNAGNDCCKAHLRDALQHQIAAHMGLDHQSYRPARVYLNGEYWGIHNIRERIDGNYLASNHGVDPDSTDLLKHNSELPEAVEGDAVHYLAMRDFIESNGLHREANYAYVQTQMDVDNFASYYVLCIYCANYDWPGNNNRLWRQRDPDGRWRWIVSDTDWALELGGNAKHETLACAMNPCGLPWPNPPWATFLFRSLLANAEFKQSFINRYADHMNSTFLPAQTMAMTAAAAEHIEEEIPRHMERWDFPVEDWTNHVESILTFFNMRPKYARSHIVKEFDLRGTLILSLDIAPPGAGNIRLTAIDVDSTWSGIYFQDVPIPLTAIPVPGYTFQGWSHPELPQEAAVEINPGGDFAVTALFAMDTSPRDTVIISEINYHSADDFDPGDWVELHNPAGSPVDLSGWIFRDEFDDRAFTIPNSTLLPAGGYLVLCRDVPAFRALFPDVTGVLGNLGFGFNAGGESLRLFDAEARLHDSVEYDDEPPWPTGPDGGGATLELIDPGLDNALPESWAASAGHGTPVAPPVSEEPPSVPELEPPFPNPISAGGQIRFSVERTRSVSVTIHDVLGRRVALLAKGRFEKGVHPLTWTGRDDAGRPFPSGVYLLRMDSEGFVASGKLLVLK